MGQRQTTSSTPRTRPGRRVAVATLVLLTACSCRPPDPPATVSESITLFDKTVTVTLPYESARHLEFASRTYRTIATRNHDLLDVLDPASELSELNRIAQSRAFPVSDETHRILYVVRQLSERTMGMFDVTLAPLSYLWGFHGGLTPSRPVSEQSIQLARRGVGFENLDVRTRQVSFASPHTRISLGDTLTSYSLDLTVIQLREKGIRDILVDGGNIARSQGVVNDDVVWTRYLTNPFTLERNLGSYRLDQGFGAATVTRNDLYVTIEGERYHHIMDPRTGTPARGTAAVTVLAPSSTDAVALAQALFVVGVENARGIMEEFPRCHVMIIPDQEPMQLWMTEGFQERLSLSPDLIDRVFLL